MATADDLDTILQLIDRIEETVGRSSADRFSASADAVDAVTYRLGMIGEHCKRLPQSIKDAHPDVPWRAMAGLRNIIAHGYDNVSPSIVWETATHELDAVRTMAVAERRSLEVEQSLARARSHEQERDR